MNELRRLGERRMLLIGMILITIGPAVLFPYSGPMPALRNETTMTTTTPSYFYIHLTQ